MNNVRQSRRALLLLTMLLAVTLVKAQLPNDSIVADFRCFVHQLETTHPDPYTNYGGKVYFHRTAAETLWDLEQDSVTSSEELCWRIRAFLAPLRDGHTQIYYPGRQSFDRLVPIRFKAAGDGMIVSRLPREYQHLIGSRLVAIENIQTKALAEEMLKLYPAENEIGKLANICTRGHQPVVLGRIIPNLRQDTITYHLMSPEGKVVRLPLALIPVEQWKEWHNEKTTQDHRFPTDNLAFAFVDKQKNTMYFRASSIMARDNIEYMRQTGMDFYDDLKYCYDNVFHQKMPTDTLEAIASMPSFSEEFEKMLLQMKHHQSENLIIDLRGNGGGWTPITLPTLYQLWGDDYLQKNFQNYFYRLVSPLYLQKINMTLEQFNAENHADYEYGDYTFYESYEETQTVTDERRAQFVNSSMSCVKDKLAKQNGRPVYTPKQVYVLTDANTFSAAFHYMFYLWKMGAKIVGVPSGQAPNTYMEVTHFSLPRTKLGGSISNSMQLFLPADDPNAKQVMPDILITCDDYRRYHFDDQAEVLYLLDYIRSQAK